MAIFFLILALMCIIAAIVAMVMAPMAAKAE